MTLVNARTVALVSADRFPGAAGASSELDVSCTKAWNDYVDGVAMRRPSATNVVTRSHLFDPDVAADDQLSADPFDVDRLSLRWIVTGLAAAPAAGIAVVGATALLSPSMRSVELVTEIAMGVGAASAVVVAAGVVGGLVVGGFRADR